MTTRLLKSAENINGLPIGFQEVEYLASNGNQWIDTGFTMESGKRMTFNGNMMWTQSQGNANFFYGYRSVNTNEYHGDMRTFFIYGASPAGRLAIRYGVNADNSTNVAVSLNTKFNIAFDGDNLKVDGTTYATLTQAYTPADYKSMWLFNCNTTGYYSADVNHFIGRIYRWQMFQDGIAVRDFIPALNPAGRPCMYDLVGKKAYYNAGTGEFSYGRKIIPVEYLESTGTQYIDTGVKLTNNHSVELDYQLTQASQLRAGLFGALNMSGSNQGRFGSILSPSNSYLEHGYGAGNDYWQQGLPDTSRHKIYQKKNEVYFDGSLVHTFNSATFSLAINAYLGNFVYTNYTPAKAKYYNSRWWEGDTLVRDYIPCIDENNTPYMFDKVTHTCYLNAGTGTFNYGKKLYSSKIRLYKDSEANKLPIGFKRVEYLESTGTQYVLTGFTPTLNTDFEIELSSTATGQNRWAIGCPTWVGVHYKGATNEVGVTCSSTATFQQYVSYAHDNSRLTMKLVGSTVYANGLELGTITKRAGSLDFALFGYRDANAGATLFFIGSIYKTKIWDNNTLVHNFIPALDTTNTPCMYDTVTQTPFYNQGTGQFTYGAIIPNKVRLPQSTEIRFPKGYTEVEYLESDSTAYIDTGISGANDNLKIEMGFSYSKFTAYGYFFSNYESESANVTRFCLNGTDINNGLAYINTKSQNGAIYTSNFSKNNFHTFILTKTSVSIDGNTTTNNNPPVGTANTKNIILFNRGSGSYTDKRDIGMRCYYFRIYDNDKLIRYFIPALDPNGKPCMWDTVTKQPFYNQGTGEFSYGRTIQQVEYLESSGTQYINTGIYPAQLTKAEIDMQFTSITKCSVLGSNNGASQDSGWNNLFGSNITGQTTDKFWCQWGPSWNGGFIKDLNRHTHTFERNGNTSWIYTVDTTSYTNSSGISTQPTNNQRVMYLFACNNNGVLYREASVKMYYCKICNNDTLIHNYVPAIDSNNVGFMFDRVTHTIFDNAGTGSFTYGSPVPNKIRN